jgi:hypothetical protein
MKNVHRPASTFVGVGSPKIIVHPDEEHRKILENKRKYTPFSYKKDKVKASPTKADKGDCTPLVVQKVKAWNIIVYNKVRNNLYIVNF